MSNIETIKKIEYQTFEQFVEDVNRNFAVVENNPLFKGLPGKSGKPGKVGNSGSRGSSFLFVDIDKFQQKFPNELVMGSEVNLNYINSKLSNQSDRETLLEALDVTLLVDKDVVVLVDSSMIGYSSVTDSFIDTGMAFNQSTNLEANINTIIERYVMNYIDNNETINSISNIIASHITYGKNYSDSNTSFITNQVLNTTVYSPFISGYNKQSGVLINNHKYIGFADNYFPISDNGTFIFGNMKKYYQLLMGTVSTDANQTLSSAYAPGVNNIPAMVILQDTYNNGILIGHKNKTNLKRFGSIYKNESDDLVIKSDTGNLISEYSELKVNRQYLKFDKLVQFNDSLEVSRNLSVFGEHNGKYFRSGIYSGTQGTYRIDIGADNNSSDINFIANDLIFKNHVGKVFVTDSAGKLLKTYKIETSTLNSNNLVDLNQLSNLPNSSTNVVTSNYLYYLGTKINNVTTFLNTNYWTKANFTANVIPSLYLTNELKVGKKLSVGSNYIDTNTGVTFFTGNEFKISSTSIETTNYKSKVLVTDSAGKVLNKYKLSTANRFLFNDNTGKFTSTYYPTNSFNMTDFDYDEVLTNKNLNTLYLDLNSMVGWFTNKYWSKEEFAGNVIPTLNLTTKLKTKDIEVTNYLITSNNTIRIGYGTNYDTSIESSNIRFTKFPSVVLVTNENGTVINKHAIATTTYTLRYTVNATSTTNLPTITISTTSDSNNNVTTMLQHNSLKTHVDNVVSWVDSTFWRKGYWNSGSIPSLNLSTSLIVSGTTALGGSSVSSNANVIVNGNSTIIGKSTTSSAPTTTTIRGGKINFANRLNKVIVTDNAGDVDDRYGVEGSTPTSSDNANVLDWFSHTIIKSKFWTKGITQTFQNFPSSATNVLTSKYFDWIVGNLKAIRDLIYDRPTYSEMNNYSPIGMIVMWDTKMNPTIPNNYVICDGRVIPGTNINTTNMMNRLPKFVNASPGVLGGNANSKVILTVDQLPKHRFSGSTDTSGSHTHTIWANNTSNTGQTSDVSTATDVSNVIRTKGGSSFQYGIQKNMQGLEPTVGRSSNSGTHAHTFNTDYVGKNDPINVEPATVTVIPIMRYK